MAQRAMSAFTWGINGSLSSWTWFGAEGPNALILPTGLQGTRLLFVATERLASNDGAPDEAAAQDLYDLDGNRVAVRIPASIPAAGVRVVFWPGAIRAHGWLALRSVDAADQPQAQSSARAAAWLVSTDDD